MARRFRPPAPRRKPRARAKRAWWREVPPIMVMLPLAAFTAVFWLGVPGGEALSFDRPAAPGADREAARFGVCSGPVRDNCVVDGDTFWYAGEKIRVADINTPEVSEPECAAEAELGRAATERLRALLNEGAFTLEANGDGSGRDRDRYGRLLREVTREGESLGAVLVREGLAEEWGGRRGSWC